MNRPARAQSSARIALLEAARRMLGQNGYAGLSTRDVAAAAGMPLSQIHYHFGSKQNLLVGLFEYMNEQLLDRQQALFGDPSLALSTQWERACDHLDEDIASGYVRVLQELTAAGWADGEVARVVRAGLQGWIALIAELATRAQHRFGGLGPFTPQELAALIATAFMGAESLQALGMEDSGVPIRAALRRFGELIRLAERSASSNGSE